MRKHLLFSVMLSLCAMGGMMVYPTPAIATVAQSPAIKVRGQVIDEQGEPLTGATVRIKGCLLYTSDADDDLLCVDLWGRRIIKKKHKTEKK